MVPGPSAEQLIQEAMKAPGVADLMEAYVQAAETLRQVTPYIHSSYGKVVDVASNSSA